MNYVLKYTNVKGESLYVSKYNIRLNLILFKIFFNFYKIVFKICNCEPSDIFTSNM